MCERCIELDDKIEHLRKIVTWVTDEMTLKGIKSLISDCEKEKRTLHPDT